MEEFRVSLCSSNRVAKEYVTKWYGENQTIQRFHIIFIASLATNQRE